MHRILEDSRANIDSIMTFDTRGAAVIVLALAVGVAILVGVAKRFVVLSLYWRILLGTLPDQNALAESFMLVVWAHVRTYC